MAFAGASMDILCAYEQHHFWWVSVGGIFLSRAQAVRKHKVYPAPANAMAEIRTKSKPALCYQIYFLHCSNTFTGEHWLCLDH